MNSTDQNPSTVSPKVVAIVMKLRPVNLRNLIRHKLIFVFIFYY